MRWLFVFFFIFVLSLSVSWSLFLSGHLDTQDGIWAVVRQAEMHREMRDLQFPPRWAGYLNHGYGYPLFLFAYPLPYLIGEVFLLFGFGVIATVKMLFFLSIFLSLMTMYIFSHRLWGTNGALISTILYAYAPYRLTNLYTRGNLGELWAFAFFPLLLYLYQQQIEKPTKNKFVATSVVTALFLLNHNASVILFAPLLGLWILAIFYYRKYKIRQMLSIGFSIIFGLLISVWFWLPAVFEKKFIALSISPLTNKQFHYLDWSNLFLGKIHTATSLFLSLGIVHIFILILALIVYIFDRTNRRLILFFAGVTGIYIWLTNAWSGMFWKLPLFSEIDFPWRSLGVVIFSVSVIGGAVGKIKHLKWLPLALFLVVFIIESPRIMSAKRIERIDEVYETNDGTTTSADELMPIWVTQKATDRQNSIFYTPTNIDGLVAYEKSNHVEFQITSTFTQDVILNKVYFPGWVLYSEGSPISISPSTPMGLVSFKTNPGTHIYNLRFEKTPIRNAADLISLGSITSLGLIWIFSKKLHLFS